VVRSEMEGPVQDLPRISRQSLHRADHRHARAGFSREYRG
jgi:hypothetical protein